MRQNIPPKQRKSLANKMCKTLKPDIKMLTKEMQEILVDDLVTAFLNRLEILRRATEEEYKHDLIVQYPRDLLELTHSRHGQP